MAVRNRHIQNFMFRGRTNMLGGTLHAVLHTIAIALVTAWSVAGVNAVAQTPNPLPAVTPTLEIPPGYVLVPAPATSAPTGSPATLADSVAGNPTNSIPPEPANTAPKLEAAWNRGAFLQSPNKDFVIHVGGVLQFDGVWYSAQPSQLYPGGAGAFNDAVDVRRARIRTEGTMYKSVDWVFEVDFAAGGFNPTGTPATQNNTFWTPAPTDMWMQMRDVPWVGTVRIGQQKEPFGLERLNSARLLNFMERSYLTDACEASAFNNNRSAGISVFRNAGPDDRIYMSAGAFKNVTDLYAYGIGDGQYAVTGRLTGLPIWNEKEQYFWHIGGAMSHRDPVNEAVRMRVRPNIRVNPLPFVNLVADTGVVPVSSKDIYGIETAGVYKSFTFQAEYQAYVLNNAIVNGNNVGSVLMGGYYAEALYFLTGESRPWNQQSAVFGRVIPKENFGFEDGHCTGTGAWELAARYSYINLTNEGIYGGQLSAVTLGVNWYWNPNARLQFNYDYMYRDEVSNPLARGIVHSFGTRLAYDF